jgi:hypothetical protein
MMMVVVVVVVVVVLLLMMMMMTLQHPTDHAWAHIMVGHYGGVVGDYRRL